MTDNVRPWAEAVREDGITLPAPTRIDPIRTAEILADVRDERIRQEAIGEAKRAAGIDWRSCADLAMDGGDPMRFAVLGEEVGEVARALLETLYAGAAGGDDHLRTELVQVAAVAVAWIEAIDARNGVDFAIGFDPATGSSWGVVTPARER